MANGFDKRQDKEGRWEVFDTGTDRVVRLDGLPLSGLDEAEADEAIERLQAREITPDDSRR
ncbi:hypothetical protein [Chelativorans sp. Marseille-P2723]|uniref:hypothetical protein n=1 Tax=Chelativorans sp. Marseille-P2723 TaxID=2709133 RepID=UPI00156FE4DA|nr:hypothetical protein [Chelativorans sp. Marseille-P2723]